jgi:hypothetical protein
MQQGGCGAHRHIVGDGYAGVANAAASLCGGNVVQRQRFLHVATAHGVLYDKRLVKPF